MGETEPPPPPSNRVSIEFDMLGDGKFADMGEINACAFEFIGNQADVSSLESSGGWRYPVRDVLSIAEARRRAYAKPEEPKTMTFNPYENRIPFGLLTDAERRELTFEGPWEYFDEDGVWSPLHGGDPAWIPVRAYRRAPKPAAIMPTVDWSCFGPAIKAVAWEPDGRAFTYCGIPTAHENPRTWVRPDQRDALDVARCYPAHAVTRGTCDWKDSLVIRPEGV